MKSVMVCLFLGLAFVMGWVVADPFERNQPKSYGQLAEQKHCELNEALERYYQLEHCFPARLSDLLEKRLLDNATLMDPCEQEWDYMRTNDCCVNITTIRHRYLTGELTDKGASLDYIVKLEITKDEGVK